MYSKLIPCAALVVALTGCSDDAPAASRSQAPGPAGTPAAAASALPVGTAVDNGRFEVAVTDFACSPPVDENKDCRLTVEVTNGTDLEQAFVHTEQFLVDDQGAQHAVSLEAMTRDAASKPFLAPIPPAQKVAGVLHYLVPADAVIVTARLTEAGSDPTDYDVANG